MRTGAASIAPAVSERREEHGSRKAAQPSEVHVKRTVNGGFIVTHRFDNSGSGESYIQPKDHAFTSHGEMMAHVHKATGGSAKVGKDGGAEVGAGGKPKGVSERAGKDDGEVAPWGGKGKGGKKPGAKTYGAGVD